MKSDNDHKINQTLNTWIVSKNPGKYLTSSVSTISMLANLISTIALDLLVSNFLDICGIEKLFYSQKVYTLLKKWYISRLILCWDGVVPQISHLTSKLKMLLRSDGSSSKFNIFVLHSDRFKK